MVNVETSAGESAPRWQRKPAGSVGRYAYLPGLIWTLIRTDFKTRYHGTIGGFTWALLKPLAMFFVLWGVFSFIFQTDPHYKLNLMLGLFVYDFFSEATKTGLVSLRTRGYLLSKAKFPSWILVVTSVSNAVITLAFLSVAMLMLIVLDGRPAAPGRMGLFLIYELALLLITIGFSLAASVLFLKYRDLNQVWEVIVQAGFFLAPVVYPLDIIPEQYHAFLYAWPPTAVIEFSRSVLVTELIPSGRAHLWLAAEAVCALIIGMVVFRRYAPHAAESL
jgi:lipopolysaccharide transport system permease protein